MSEITPHNNPHNPTSDLYKRLTRLMSGPLVQHRTQTERNLRKKHLDKHASRFRTMSGQPFKRANFNPLDRYRADRISGKSRVERYADFEQMEYEPIISSIMDQYADEMTTHSIYHPLLKIESQNEEIKEVLRALYHNILNIEFNLAHWCRNMCKYGDFFLYLDVDEDQGIKSVVGLPAKEMERMEGEDPTNPNYFQFQWNTAGQTFEYWQVAHFRILADDKYAPYGRSVLEPARRIWRQLLLIEDAMMAYRIVRSPERRVFYIDVGAIEPESVEAYMQQVISELRRNRLVDPVNGKIDLRFNPLSVEEDYYLPVRGDQTSTRIETLPGGQYVGVIDDVKYLKDKLFAALKVPQSYLFRGDGDSEDKTTLAQKDIHFARTIQRLQLSITSELRKIGTIHLYIMGYRGEDLVEWNLSLNNPSQIAELQVLEQWRTKFEVAGAALEGFFSRRWIADNIFGMTMDEFLRNQRELFYDRKFEMELERIAQEFEEMAAGAAGGGLEGEMGATGEMPPEGELEAAPGDDNVLLAQPPGKRDDEGYLTAGAKGKKYVPVQTDNRKTGARRRSYQSKFSKEMSSNTRRNTSKGLQPLLSLGNGIYESYENAHKEEQSNYDDTLLQENLLREDEEKVLAVDNRVRVLLERLERKFGKDEESSQ